MLLYQVFLHTILLLGIRDDAQNAPVSVRCGLFNNSTQIQPDDGTINTIIRQPVTSDDSTTNLGKG